jgi:FAD/FMN-containing dehydrogenase
MAEYDRRELLQRAGLGAAALTASTQLEVASALAGAQSSHHVGNKALRQLRRMVRGRVFTPGDNGYHHVRRVYNTRFNNIHPEAVVRVRDVADVQAVMKWANRFDVQIRARSGGHSYAGYSTTRNGVVVDLSRLQRIHRSDGNRSVAIGAGAGLMQMYSKLAKAGVTVPGGSCPTVGITGLALGGGMGFASRKYGLTCDNLTGVSIVTPDGKFLKVDENNQPGLLWACRGGGGGNFGIVTSLTFKTHPVKRASYYFASWPWSQASAALAAWQRLTEEAPPELCPFFSFLTGSGSPEVRSEGQFFGSERDLRRALKPLRDVEGIQLTVGSKRYGDLMKQWAGCENESVKSCEKPDRSTFFAASDYVQRALDSSGRAAMMRAIEQRQGEGGSGAILLDGYGGKINEVHSRATSFVHRDQLYCIQYYSQAANKGQRRGASKWVEDARHHMRHHVSGQAYQNYIDPRLRNWQHAYYGHNYERLVEVKTRYDPDNRLRFPQGIRPRS